VFLHVAPYVTASGRKGIIFAYDEAQNMSDHAATNEFPLSVLLDVFQSIQRQNIPFMLLLVGLPTLFPKLVAARTYTERMFRVLFLKQLTVDESRDAIIKPVSSAKCPVTFQEPAIKRIIKYSGGYPYFLQFMCREAYDTWLQKTASGETLTVPAKEIIRKLDNDFFAGRWARVTDRQQLICDRSSRKCQ
jgi:type II secretory pathway predicted ATPase ExeA